MKPRYYQVSDAGAANEKTEQELVALLPPDPPCQLLPVELRRLKRERVAGGRGYSYDNVGPRIIRVKIITCKCSC